MTTPINTQPSPFTDPNNALREFNAYFGSLRKDYGEDAIRAMGFTPRDLAALQASLRKLQMDPTATPEQHRQAYMQARDTLAQRITTPLASTRSYAQVQGLGQSTPQSVTASDGTVVEVARPNLPMATPTQEQLYEYARGVAKGQQSQWDPRIGKFVPVPTEAAASPFAVTPEVEVRGVRPPDGVGAPPPMPETVRPPVTPPMPEMEVRRVTPPPPPPPMPEMEVPRVTPPKPAELPMPPVGSPALLGNAPRPVDPSMVQPTAPGILPGIMPMRPPAPSMMSPTMLGNTPPMPVAPPPMAQPDVTAPWNLEERPYSVVDNNRVAAPIGKPRPPEPTLSDMFKGGIGGIRDMLSSQSTPMQPTAPGILPGIMQQQPAAPSMNTQPGADFDRNVARQIFDSEFRTLREKYGDSGLRAAGFTPRTLASLQAPLTNVQKDNTISYDQSSAALENALKQLRGYNFGGAQPAAPMQPAAPAPSMGGTLGGLLGGLLPKPPTNVVDPGMNIPSDPNFRFGTSPQAPNPNAQGMAMGGLINKYYR